MMAGNGVDRLCLNDDTVNFQAMRLILHIVMH